MCLTIVLLVSESAFGQIYKYLEGLQEYVKLFLFMPLYLEERKMTNLLSDM